MKTTFFQLGLIAVCMVSASCSDKVENESVSNGKSPISFSTNLNIESNVTSRAAFTADTKLGIRITSNKAGAESTTTSVNAIGVATANTAEGATVSNVTFATAEQKYWDDLYGRDAQLSVAAVAVPSMNEVALTNSNSLSFGSDNTRSWTLSATQTADTYAKEDLVFSNNIKMIDTNTDSRLKYNSGFPTGNLNFKHALSKITVNLIKGEGFSSDFTSKSVVLNGFYKNGTIDVLGGSFNVASGTVSDMTAYAITTNPSITNCQGTFQALVIPSRDLTSTTKALSVTVDNNTYYIAANKIAPNGVTALESNKNYTVNVTVNKTGVSLTASLTDWDNTSLSELTPVIVAGAGIGTNGTNGTMGSFDIYRSTTNINYDENTTTTDEIDKATTCTQAAGSYTMNPQIYWPDHTTSYYFRGLTAGTSVTKGDDTNGNYVAVTTIAGTTAAGGDLCAGAPYSGTSLVEAKKATDGPQVNFTFTHKKPQIFVQLTTTTGADAVNLTGATVSILNSITSGNLFLKNLAFVLGTTRTATYSMGSAASVTLPKGTAPSSNVYSCYVLPQTLNGIEKKVTLEVKTADNNTYPVNIYSNTASWQEGKQYVYILTMKKTGITLTASLTDWDPQTSTIDVKL